MRTEEETVHDRVNLPRLMKRLEQSVQDSDWASTDPPRRGTWLHAQALLQQIRHARRLLKNVQLDNVDPTPAEERRYQHYATTLKHLEDYMRQVEQQTTPPARRPKPILPTIRPPPPKSPPPSKPTESPVEATLISTEPDVHDLLPTSPHLPAPSPLPPSHADTPRTHTPTFPGALAPPAASAVTATPTLLQNSRALQDELSEQLALMAAQLHRNATHFAQSLQQDRAVLDATQEKLEGNLGFLTRERTRLRDFRGTSGGTTCLAITSVLIVLIAFIIMVFIIRLT